MSVSNTIIRSYSYNEEYATSNTICSSREWKYFLAISNSVLIIIYYVNYNRNNTQRPWVRFWGPKNVAASCTHLGPAQVMEVIIIDV